VNPVRTPPGTALASHYIVWIASFRIVVNTEPETRPADAGWLHAYFKDIAFFILLVCINTVIARFVVISFDIGPGVSYLYVVVAAMIIFTLWFGMCGAVAAYAGCFIGAGVLGGIPLDVNIVWSLADFWQVVIPLMAFRFFGADPSVRTARDMGVLLVFGIVVNNLVGAIWGSLSLFFGGLVGWADVAGVFFGWWIGNMVVCIVIVPLLLYLLTPAVRSHELYSHDFWH